MPHTLRLYLTIAFFAIVNSLLICQVWIDVFVLREYHSELEIRAEISVKENGKPQQIEYISGIIDSMTTAGIMYPCFHFDNRKAIEMWPREFFLVQEIQRNSLRLDIPFAHLGPLPVPTRPVL